MSRGSRDTESRGYHLFMENKSFYCVFCKEWVKVSDFDNHMMQHDSENFDMKVPSSYNEYRERMEIVGMWYERFEV